jgi:alkanesulfonate monooxygenase SsuD/methylene tetrahydromethanopterin reductase-like flavin-dependent oxidoreductase (luciferase family)
VIGDPDDVAAALTAFARAGFDGITLSFLNYADELGYFAQEVLPRLESAGIRGS